MALCFFTFLRNYLAMIFSKKYLNVTQDHNRNIRQCDHLGRLRQIEYTVYESEFFRLRQYYNLQNSLFHTVVKRYLYTIWNPCELRIPNLFSKKSIFGITIILNLEHCAQFFFQNAWNCLIRQENRKKIEKNFGHNAMFEDQYWNTHDQVKGCADQAL